MERIQEAIARARAERQGKIGQLPDAEKTLIEKAAEKTTERKPAQSSRKTSSSIPVPIHYEQTRQVELDPEFLEGMRVIAGAHDDKRVEAYRHLRTHVLQILKKNNWSTLAITSPYEDAGKTLTAVNLAISLSQEVNQTVLLVDLDLRKPNMHETFGIEIDKGIIDCIEDGEPLENVLVNPGMQRLVLLPGRATGEYSSELLTSPAMHNLLEDIKTRYASRIIIFDLPPLLRNDDALVFTPQADATLMVVEEGKNSNSDVERSLHLLSGANLIGTILNKAR